MKDTLKRYGVGTKNFKAAEFAELCAEAETRLMDPQSAMKQLLLRYPKASAEEQQYLNDLFMKAERQSGMPPIPGPDFVTPDNIRNFRNPSTSIKPDFSAERNTIAQLFGPYFDGKMGKKKGTKTRKATVARYGHLEKSAAINFSEMLNPKSKRRKANFEAVAMCCLYFQVEPVYAITLFHKCLGVDELASHKYVGAGLWLFLEDECYDYEKYVTTCCKALKAEHALLPDSVAKSRYWKEVYASV